MEQPEKNSNMPAQNLLWSGRKKPRAWKTPVKTKVPEMNSHKSPKSKKPQALLVPCRAEGLGTIMVGKYMVGYGRERKV